MSNPQHRKNREDNIREWTSDSPRLLENHNKGKVFVEKLLMSPWLWAELWKKSSKFDEAKR